MRILDEHLDGLQLLFRCSRQDQVVPAESGSAVAARRRLRAIRRPEMTPGDRRARLQGKKGRLVHEALHPCRGEAFQIVRQPGRVQAANVRPCAQQNPKNLPAGVEVRLGNSHFGHHELQKVIDGDRENAAAGERFCRHRMGRTQHCGGRSKRSSGEADANRDSFTPMFPSQQFDEAFFDHADCFDRAALLE